VTYTIHGRDAMTKLSVVFTPQLSPDAMAPHKRKFLMNRLESLTSVTHTARVRCNRSQRNKGNAA